MEILKGLDWRRRSCRRLRRRLARGTSSIAGSGSAKRSFGGQSGINSVERGFVDDSFLEEAFELLL